MKWSTLIVPLVVSFARAIAFAQVPLTTAQIAKKVSPSVVVIQGKSDSRDVLGSGFIISKDGKIVTNLHVIRDMKTVQVQLADGRVFESLAVLGVDEGRDLAIIKIAGSNFNVLPLGNSDSLAVGERVVVVGSPLGLDATVTAGILSAIRDTRDGYKLLQTDAAVNHGNSGGPLVNDTGLVIGVVSSIVRSDSAQGLNFAIPINYVNDLLTNLHGPITLEAMRNTLTLKTAPYRPEPPPLLPREPPVSSPPPKEIGRVSLAETLNWLNNSITHLTSAKYLWSTNGESKDISVSYSVNAYPPDEKNNRGCYASFRRSEIRTSRLTPDTPQYLLSGFSFYLGAPGIEVQTNIEPIRYTCCDAVACGVSIHSQYNIIESELLYDVDIILKGDRPKYEDTNSAVLFFGDEPSAIRVRDALQHATNLCRVKEPF